MFVLRHDALERELLPLVGISLCLAAPSHLSYTRMTMRINARIEPPLAKKLAYLKARSGETTSTILKKAIEAYFEQQAESSASPLQLLDESGFVGCAEGPANLSVNVKRELTRALKSKFRDHRR